jgi:hypothetical protein
MTDFGRLQKQRSGKGKSNFKITGMLSPAETFYVNLL